MPSPACSAVIPFFAPAANKTDHSLKNTIDIHNRKTGNKLVLPKQTLIPSHKDVKPQKADEIAPSSGLLKIINEVKNQSIPRALKSSRKDKDYEISKEAHKIIKTRKSPLDADQVKPSPALQSVLKAYHNGSLSYTHRNFDSDAESDQVYYHQPYTDIKLESVYDLTILRTGKDIFLSLGYTPLQQEVDTEVETKSRRIRDLQQTIYALKMTDSQRGTGMTPESKELERIKAATKIKIEPRKLLVKQLLDFFGIRPKDEVDNYEKMAHAYSVYKQWFSRWERLDRMMQLKRAQKMKLAPFQSRNRKKGTDCSNPAFRELCPDTQLKIDPYSNGNIRLLKTR